MVWPFVVVSDTSYFIGDTKYMQRIYRPFVRKTKVFRTPWQIRNLSFSEDDCTRQRGLKAVVQSSIERTVSGVRCTNDDLKPVLVALATDQPLDVRYRDHDLSGDWAGYRECHIKPDLLLIYRKSDADTLRLARLGSHSELFG